MSLNPLITSVFLTQDASPNHPMLMGKTLSVKTSQTCIFLS